MPGAAQPRPRCLQGLVTVTGRPTSRPRRPWSCTPAPDAATAWGGRWPYLTIDLYRATVAHPVQPVVILLDPSDEGGFVRDWPREMPKEGMHLGYAVQWFAFALIGLAIWVRLSLEAGARAGGADMSGRPEQTGKDAVAVPARRGVRPLLIMVGIFAAPVLAAWFFYFNPQYLPSARGNRRGA